MKICLSKRLLAIAKLVDGKTVVDVGCDAANLAIWLAQNKNVFTYASDLRAGPLVKARFNVEKFGVAGQVKLIQARGLEKAPSFVDEVVISGLGGEQIEQIVLHCDWLRKFKTKLILQPQSFSVKLRQRLSLCGFEIKNEVYVVDSKKAYLIFVARFCGVFKKLSLKQTLTGHMNKFDENCCVWVEQTKEKIERALNGLSLAKQTAEVLEKISYFKKVHSILLGWEVV